MIVHKFVDLIPDELQENVVYVSIKYNTAIHNCFCGCKSEVVTPLSPIDWELTYDGATVSLHPSIGNWNFKCKSHYYIKNNSIIWVPNKKTKEPKRKTKEPKRKRKINFLGFRFNF